MDVWIVLVFLVIVGCFVMKNYFFVGIVNGNFLYYIFLCLKESLNVGVNLEVFKLEIFFLIVDVDVG